MGCRRLAAWAVFLAAALSVGNVNGAAAQTVPRITRIIFIFGAESNNTYERGEELRVRVTFSTSVVAAGAPQIGIRIGPQTRYATLVENAEDYPTTTLDFIYAIQTGDRDTNGAGVPANSLRLNGGSIRSSANRGVNAALAHAAVPDDGARLVNGSLVSAPGISNSGGYFVLSNPPADGTTYTRGEEIWVVVQMDRAVTVTGSPRAGIRIGANTRYASYDADARTIAATPNADFRLWFTYTVQSNDTDTDGINMITNAISLNGGTIRLKGTTSNANLANQAKNPQSNRKVDGSSFSAPRIDSISFFKNGPAFGDTYGKDETIEAVVYFDHPLTVTGTPKLTLAIGSNNRDALYPGANPRAHHQTLHRRMRFRYTVQAADRDANGLSIAANALSLNGGTIRAQGTTTNAVITHSAVAADANRKVDGSLVTPEVAQVAFGNSPASGNAYRLAEEIEVTARFDSAVAVATSGGTPSMALAIGSNTRQATYDRMSGQNTLVFGYTVQSGDLDADGMEIAPNSLLLNGGAVTLASGTAPANLQHNAVARSTSRQVNGSPPAPSDVAFRTTGPYELGVDVRVAVAFSMAVDVTGAPELALGIGADTVDAAYDAARSGRDTLVFGYTVQPADRDANGISIAANALALSGATIRAVVDPTVDANLDLGSHAVSDASGHEVDGSAETAPSVTGAAFVSSPASGDTYGTNEEMRVALSFDRVIAVTGTPQLALAIGSGTGQATYVAGASTNRRMVFAYSVRIGDMDADGAGVAANALTLAGGSIILAGGSTGADLDLGMHAISGDAGHKVEGRPPAPSGVAFRTSGPYDLGEEVRVAVAFDLKVDVTGTPQLALGIGADMRHASYDRSRSGSDTLVFGYTVQSADLDADGISIAANAIGLNGGAIQAVLDPAAAAIVDLGGHAVANASGQMVDGGVEMAPSVTGVAFASSPVSGDTYGTREEMRVAVSFDRIVAVTGTPQLALTIGTETGQASYDASRSTSRRLVFAYSVRIGDLDADGASVGSAALTLAGGTIILAGGSTAANLNLGAHVVSNDANHKVEGRPPAPNGVAFPTTGPYELGVEVRVAVTFDFPVVVTGAPRLTLGIGADAPQASYDASRSSGTTLAFVYLVQSADRDADGISIAADALVLNGAAIRDLIDVAADADLNLGIHAVSNDPDQTVDGSVETAPTVTGVAFASSPVRGTSYARGESIRVVVAFNRAVAVTGAPHLALGIGSGTRPADYGSGSGTSSLTFGYMVQSSDSDGDGLSIPTDALALNGGTIKIAGGGADAVLDLGSHAVANAVGHEVDGPGEVGFETLKYEFELTENVAGPVAVGVVLATDPYEGNVTYALGEGGEGLFEVAEWGGEVTYVGEGADAEERSEYVLEVVATAEDGRFGKALVRVKVLNVNEPPAYGDERLAFELAENVAGPVVLGVAAAVDRDEGDTLTYRLESGDVERFEVDAGTAEVRYVGGGEDYDTDGPKAWELEVRATDKAGLSAGTTVAVVLRNKNEAPAFADSTYAFEFAENVAGPLVLGTVRATDPDAGDRLVYALASGDAGRFEVDAASGEVRYVGAGEDYETGPGRWELVVRVADGGGLTADASVVVALVDENEAPAFADASYEWEFEENVAGPLVLGTVRATDPDRADTLTYSLAGADADRFEIDAATGEVRYVGAGEDAEAGPEGWEFEVMVVDGGGLTAKAPVTVVLLDVNEAPLFADSAYAFELPENASGPRELGRVEATDVDADDVLTYSITSGDAGRFEVDAATGVVRYLGGGEDYETGPREYALMLRVMDTGGLTDEASAVVTLLDVNEGPEAVGSMAPKVLEAYGAAVEEELGPYFLDPDGDALSYAAESSVAAVAVATVSSGRLSIAPQGIGVATVTVRATDPGGLEATQQVQVTVEASRSERTRALKLALAAFGRSLGAETVEAIGGRLGVESSGSLGRSHVQLGGRSLGCAVFGGGGAFGGSSAGTSEGGTNMGGQVSCGWEQLARSATGLLGLQLTGPTAMGQGTGQYRGQQEPAEPGSMDLEQQRGGLTFNPVSGRQMRSQSSFQLSFGGANADAATVADAGEFDDDGVLPSQAASRAGWTLWGQANAGEFEGTPDEGLSLEGRTQSAYVGLDYRFGSGLLLGLAGSRSAMKSDFDSKINGAGTVDAHLTSLYPYLHWSPREGLGLWGLVGAGRGDADLAEVAGGQFSTDLDMRMGALGVRQELVGALALKADAFSVRIESADGGELAGVTAEAQRVRLAPELTGQWTVGDGGVSVRTRVELGGRYDGGDAETGLGAEAGAEFGFAHLGSGFSVDARGRTLLAHQEDQFREWGASFAVRLQPGRDRGGLSFSLEPSWGDAAGGAQALWQAQGGGFGGQALGRDAATTTADAPGWTPDRMAMELGWGVVLLGGGEVKPFGRWSREGADGYRLNAGTRWTALGETGDGEGEGRSRGLRLMIDFFGEQVAGGVRPTERRIGLLGQIGFK